MRLSNTVQAVTAFASEQTSEFKLMDWGHMDREGDRVDNQGW